MSAQTKPKDDGTFSASEMAKRHAEKELEGYSRAFAARDRIKAAHAKVDKPTEESKTDSP
jgi:hypothetical protein